MNPDVRYSLLVLVIVIGFGFASACEKPEPPKLPPDEPLPKVTAPATAAESPTTAAESAAPGTPQARGLLDFAPAAQAAQTQVAAPVTSETRTADGLTHPVQTQAPLAADIPTTGATARVSANAAATTTTTASEGEPVYVNDFEQAAEGAVPKGMMALLGDFKVAPLPAELAAAGGKALMLPGEPLENYGLLFGPAAAEGLSVSARIHAAARGRTQPQFGIGLGGVSGWHLVVAPARKALELQLEDKPVVSVPYAWKSGGWTRLRLALRRADEGRWLVQGKAWADGAKEPGDWMITHELTKAPFSGRPGVFAMPFSGRPTWFDDLAVNKVE